MEEESCGCCERQNRSSICREDNTRDSDNIQDACIDRIECLNSDSIVVSSDVGDERVSDGSECGIEEWIGIGVSSTGEAVSFVVSLDLIGIPVLETRVDIVSSIEWINWFLGDLGSSGGESGDNTVSDLSLSPESPRGSEWSDGDIKWSIREWIGTCFDLIELEGFGKIGEIRGTTAVSSGARETRETRKGDRPKDREDGDDDDELYEGETTVGF